MSGCRVPAKCLTSLNSRQMDLAQRPAHGRNFGVADLLEDELKYDAPEYKKLLINMHRRGSLLFKSGEPSQDD